MRKAALQKKVKHQRIPRIVSTVFDNQNSQKSKKTHSAKYIHQPSTPKLKTAQEKSHAKSKYPVVGKLLPPKHRVEIMHVEIICIFKYIYIYILYVYIYIYVCVCGCS